MAQAMVRDISTDRLDIRSWRPSLHGQAFERLCLDLEPLLVAQVLDHLPPSMALGPGPDAIARWVRDRDREAQVMLVRRTRGDLIGLLILTAPGDEPRDIHLGYLLAPSAWGEGYGTELVKGLVASARESLPAGTLIGGVARDNPASARVLQKAGFEPMAPGDTPDTDFYRLDL